MHDFHRVLAVADFCVYKVHCYHRTVTVGDFCMYINGACFSQDSGCMGFLCVYGA